jgi:predicted oxidoreductase
MTALNEPPFYAMELTPAFVNTLGGPRRNKDAQIIGVDGAPIGRLYSAGELGSIYAFLYQGDGNIGECFAFGRVAGRNAAKEKHFKTVQKPMPRLEGQSTIDTAEFAEMLLP